MITVGKMALESLTLDLFGTPLIVGEAVQVSADHPKKRALIVAAMRLSDASLTPMPTIIAGRLAAGKQIEGLDSEQLAARILRNDSRQNITRTRPVVHLFFASEKRLPTPLEARDAILETILKIPYRIRTLG